MSIKHPIDQASRFFTDGHKGCSILLFVLFDTCGNFLLTCAVGFFHHAHLWCWNDDSSLLLLLNFICWQRIKTKTYFNWIKCFVAVFSLCQHELFFKAWILRGFLTQPSAPIKCSRHVSSPSTIFMWHKGQRFVLGFDSWHSFSLIWTS